jgi:hypothetical protein
VCCQVIGIVAWIMGNNDLREIDAGIMDPTGRDMTNVGRILGMIGVALLCLWIVFVLLWFLLFAGIVATSA